MGDDASAHNGHRRVYITQSYRSPWGTINSLWASAREYDFIPDRIHLLSPASDSKEVRSLVAGLEALQEQLGRDPDVDVIEDDPEDFRDTALTIERLVVKARSEDAEVAVDLTPGRTIPKIALFDVSLREEPDHIFYLSVPEYDYRPAPYVKIPFRMQNQMDLLEEIDRDGR